ncbi:hypothetical protein ACTFQ7_18965 [Bacillus cereus group sp. MYBK226-2]|uniref:hypothetical protein n=1 Tax=Bacillus cereus group sp. MYBK226-2 TaxID=3450655 RepID=UPI003F799168
MKFKDMVECMDNNCRTVVIAKHVDGLRCVRCGGATRPMPFAPMRKQTEEDLHKPKIKFEITIDGVINVEDQIVVQKLYDSLVEFTTNYGGMSVTKDSGELSIMEAKEEGTLKVLTITPDATTFYGKNIGLIADEVYKRMSEDFQKGLRTRS